MGTHAPRGQYELPDPARPSLAAACGWVTSQVIIFRPLEVVGQPQAWLLSPTPGPKGGWRSPEEQTGKRDPPQHLPQPPPPSPSSPTPTSPSCCPSRMDFGRPATGQWKMLKEEEKGGGGRLRLPRGKQQCGGSSGAGWPPLHFPATQGKPAGALGFPGEATSPPPRPCSHCPASTPTCCPGTPGTYTHMAGDHSWLCSVISAGRPTLGSGKFNSLYLPG